MSYRSTKLIDGFSTCFRQWRAEGTHCKFLHGYSISFKVIFEGELDDRNWVVDFGFLSRQKIGDHEDATTLKQFFNFMFDHTTVVAQDDPQLPLFQQLAEEGIIQLRVMPTVGCEKFAEFVFGILKKFVHDNTGDRVRVVSVECFEHHKNSAIYSE